jgi:hypothetical protein
MKHAMILSGILYGPEPEDTTAITLTTLVFWIACHPPPSPTWSWWGGSALWVAPELLDEKGYRFGPMRCAQPRYWSGAPGQQVTEEALELFPRRGRTVRLRLYDMSGQKPVAEFVTANPIPGPQPVWTPAPLPIVKHSGDVDFTLTQLATVLGHANPMGLVGSSGDAWTEATFRVTRDGRATRDWEPVEVTLSDATGNSLVRRGSLSHHRGSAYWTQTGDLSYRFDGGLSLDEAAWKMRFEFTRRSLARFAPEELWTVPDLPIASGRKLLPANATTTLDGVTLRLASVARTGTRPAANGRGPEEWLELVRVEAPSLQPGQAVTLHARDDRGREFVPTHRILGSPHWSRSDRFLLRIPADARTLDLTFALHRSRFVEFVAKPSPR